MLKHNYIVSGQNPSNPHHDIGEVQPHERIQHNIHLKKHIERVIDAPVFKIPKPTPKPEPKPTGINDIKKK